MRLHCLGINYRHESDFSIERPNGSGDNLLLIFKTPAKVVINGIIQHVQADSAVLFSCGFPQYYSADCDKYINHWVHFYADENDDFFRRINLPFNTIINASDVYMIESLLSQLNSESLSDGNNREECVDLILRLIMAKLSEDCKKSCHSSVHSEKLRLLRSDIYSNPSEFRSVAKMAEQLSLSPSHFQALYKSEFGISCYEDVLNARLERAKYYLKNTSLSVSRIAELCGYENDVHFIRQFKLRTGLTASAYRKNHS